MGTFLSSDRTARSPSPASLDRYGEEGTVPGMARLCQVLLFCKSEVNLGPPEFERTETRQREARGSPGGLGKEVGISLRPVDLTTGAVWKISSLHSWLLYKR